MQHGDYPQRTILRHADCRHQIDLPALIMRDGIAPLEARLINLSRHGFRLALPVRLAAGTPFTLKISGWPELMSGVVWSDSGRCGCLFDTPPSAKLYSQMMAAVGEMDRDSF